jgi:hypothetical protein
MRLSPFSMRVYPSKSTDSVGECLERVQTYHIIYMKGYGRLWAPTIEPINMYFIPLLSCPRSSSNVAFFHLHLHIYSTLHRLEASWGVPTPIQTLGSLLPKPANGKKTQPTSNPHPNLVTSTSIPQPPKNIRRKLNPTHPITLLIPNQSITGWKPMENPQVQLVKVAAYTVTLKLPVNLSPCMLLF